MKGNCYAASEALYHLLGGKDAGWTPTYISGVCFVSEDTRAHWFLRHESGLILDATASQFDTKPDYSKGVGCGFLTDAPSKRARALMDKLVWQ